MSQFSQIVAATFDRTSNEKNKAANQWSENATLRFLEMKGALKRVTGGPQLEFTLDTIANPDAAFLATDVSATSTTKTEVLDAVKYDWALVVSPVNWTISDEAKNSGDKKVDLVTSLVDNGMETHDDKFEGALFAASATNGFLSFPVILTEDGSGTVGGVNSATDTYWANKFADYGTDVHLGLNTLFAACAKGSGGAAPNLIVTAPTPFATYADSLQANFQYTNAKTVDAGIQTLKFGGADLIFSHKYTSGTADSFFMLNTKKIKLYVIKDFYRQRRAEIELPNAATMSMKVVSMAQIAATDRSRNGVAFT
ncbi:MAG: hypothetical protein A3E01_06085 [Gammaproteobacteria bacterium RIFCSPHIGHO2_12_FULL_63_22]|nr:MAG: hypothetical protein A3E01_06085 [Gammaproteobacteria bacterium RIFCSPHIGHO2_12_FULL_63_22]